MVDALKSFLVRVGIVPTSARAGVELERWRGAPLDLELIKALHRGLVGDRTTVRRIEQDGSAVLAPARPGQLRTSPQALRIGEHTETAWEQGRLEAGLVELASRVAPRLDDDPVGVAAELVWAASRAQPFAGLNERVALVLASWVLFRAGLPPLHVVDVERDAAFAAALLPADRVGLARYIDAAVWDEALALVESFAPDVPPPPARWTLADEHAARTAARARATRIPTDELEAVIGAATVAIERALASMLDIAVEPPRRERLDDRAARFACARDAATRGRRICPHEPITVVRWSVDEVIAAKLVVASAGLGVTGAACAHFALELADGALAAPWPALLLIADEVAHERNERMVSWTRRAVERAVELCPIRF